jgi:nucleoside-diphosphate-sugar epimerase
LWRFYHHGAFAPQIKNFCHKNILMNILITGGAGFIGSNLVEALVKRGEKVRVLDNFSTGKRENLLPFSNQIEVIEGDIRSYHIVREAIDGMEVIFHQAALPSVPRSIKDPLTTNEVNATGTLNLLQAAKDVKVRRIVYASSSSIYGNNNVLPKRESMIPRPLSPYAVSKLAGEEYCRIFTELYGLETVSLRYFNVFGPRQDPTSQYSAVIPKFISAFLNVYAITVYGDGSQTRDFTFVGNVVKANLLAMESDKAVGKVFNIASGKSHTLKELIELLKYIFNKDPNIKYVTNRKGDVIHSYADITLASEIIGYKVSIDFEEGLKATVDWFLTANKR